MPEPWRPGAPSAGEPAARAGQVQIVTRSGNTATPDETWSAWSNAYTNADGERIGSPNARYLQWRATMTSDSAQGPVLTSVTAAYLPRNLRPEVTSITVHPPGCGVPAAVLDRRRGDCRLRRQHLRRPAAESEQRRARRAPRPRPRRSAAASIRKVCRRSSGRRRTRTTTGCSTTPSTGVKAKRPGRC